VDEAQLFPYTARDYQALGAGFVSARVVQILPEKRQVLLANGEALGYERLLLATGAQAIVPAIAGIHSPGAFKLDTLEDARALLAFAKHAHSAVVTGGGITALELAEGLAARKKKVHYLLRGSRYWSSVLDETESKIVEERLRREGIVLHFGSEAREILTKNNRVSAVKLADSSQIRCEVFAYAVGIAPRADLARQAGLACEKGVLVNEAMQTSDSSVYAAGDLAQVYDPLAGRHVLDSLWTTAREQGRAAGLAMSGGSDIYNRSIPVNVTRLAGLTVTIIGAVGTGRSDDQTLSIVRGDSETWREVPGVVVSQGGFDVNRMRLMLAGNHLVGAVLVGDQKLSAPLQAIIRQRADISSIRASLLAPQARLSDILADFWHKQSQSLSRSESL
jgi:NAD(P)H-nitrite reductase large subunit